MTLERGQPEKRDNLNELEPDVRARLLALDEPVAWTDWTDVVNRSRRPSLWAKRLVLVGLVSTFVAAAAVGSTLGIWPYPSTAHDTGIPGRTLTAAGRLLYVVPSAHGGFCYRWTGVTNGCDPLSSAPLEVTWESDRLVGTVSSHAISSVRITFTDGSSAKPPITWVSAPVNAGLFVFTIPTGKTVAEINGLDARRVLRRVTWFSV